MNKQQKLIYETLKENFSLPVFEDELAEDEYPDSFNYFFIIYGDFRKTKSVGRLVQEIFVVYVTENNTSVETTSLDVITTVSNVPGINFERTVKERLQKDDTDSFVDQVTFIFTRMISHEC